jgi:hypothetical protein
VVSDCENIEADTVHEGGIRLSLEEGKKKFL